MGVYTLSYSPMRAGAEGAPSLIVVHAHSRRGHTGGACPGVVLVGGARGHLVGGAG